MSEPVNPIGCTGACDQGRRPCTCIPDLDAEIWGEPIETPVPWWEEVLFWIVVCGLAAVVVGGWGWLMGWWL